MNLSKLSVGQVVKNYRAMCELLGEKVTDGNSKKAQMKEWERQFKYHKEGHKFVIDEIYGKTKQKAKNKRNDVYGEMAQLLILDTLVSKKEKHISISKSHLLKELGIVNDNYNVCKGNMDRLSNYLNMDIQFIWEFYNVQDSNFKSIIDKALRTLEDERLIMVETVFKVKHTDSRKHKRAEKWELELIMKCEKDVLDQLGYVSVSQVRKSKHWQEFKKLSNKAIKEVSNIQYYYKAYDICINELHLEKAKEKLVNKIESFDDRIEMMGSLNGVVCKRVITNAKNRHNSGSIKSKYWLLRTDKNYLDNTKRLTTLLVDADAPRISNDVINADKQAVHTDLTLDLPF